MKYIRKLKYEVIMKHYSLKLVIQKLIISIFIFPISLLGQSEVLLFKTLEDYKMEKGIIADNVLIAKRKDKEIKTYGGNDYVISASDKKLSYVQKSLE
jgi:hypothetical protein